MSRTALHPKESSFNLRIDPTLKAAFSRAAESEDKPAAQVLREFMRAYVARREQAAFAAEAQRQSREAAIAARDPHSDDHASLKAFEALLDADAAAAWKA